MPRRMTTLLTGAVSVLLAVTLLPSAALASGTWSGNERKAIPTTATSSAYIADLEIYEKRGRLKDARHMPTEYADGNGFWYAVPYNPPVSDQRKFAWRYQPYGVWCQRRDLKVGYNPWLDGYHCIPNETTLEADFPGYRAETDKCRAATGGRAWSIAVPEVEDGKFKRWWCSNHLNDPTDSRNTLFLQSTGLHSCSPWEDKSDDPRGGWKCNYTYYSWLNDPAHPGGYEPPVTQNPDGQFTARATASAESQQTIAASPNVKATATVRRVVIIRKHAVVKGKKRYVGTGKAPIRITRSAWARERRTATRTATGHGSATCTRTSAETAQACANTAAQNQATKNASDAAANAARAAATEYAQKAGHATAHAKAVELAKTAKITKSERKTAADLAKKRARTAALRLARRG